MSNKAISATEVVRQVIDRLRASLPSAWKVECVLDAPAQGVGRSIDTLVTLRGADGSTADFAIETKSHIEPKDVQRLSEEAKQRNGTPSLIAAAFLSPRTRELLRQKELSYADSTGNLWFVLAKPVVWVERAGASENPWHEARALQSLKGGKGGRVVRALCDFRPPYGVRELAQRAQVTPAAISRVADILERDALLTKDARGRIVQVDWSGALRRWTDNYRVLSSNRMQSFLEPRGLPHLLGKLPQLGQRHAVSGSLAAARRSPIASSRLAMVYVDEVASASRELGLRPTEAGANVMLLAPFDEVVYDRTTSADGVVYAAASQVAVDLLTSPGRGPEEREGLLAWMKEHESDWRT
jgi:hypothetical protein